MDLLSPIWHKIQRTLFPEIEEDIGPLSKKQKQLIAILELARVEELVHGPRRGYVGRPEDDRRAMARAFVAKTVYNIPITKALIEQLKSDKNLRQICGWELKEQVPSEASFSRAFAEFANTALPAMAHTALIQKHQSLRLVGHISKDSSAIVAREKPVKKEKPDVKQNKKAGRGRPKKGEQRPAKIPTRLERQIAGMSLQDMLDDLPTACDVGSKKNSRGYLETWIGYKIHADWADGEIPISCLLTSASVHDSQVAIPLAEISAKRVCSLYDLMDSAYDAPQIKAFSQSLGHVPIIDSNQRRGVKIEMDPAKAERFKSRTTAERGFSLLKDNFGGNFVRVRGHAKVFAHLMFGILAITAEQLLRLCT